MRNFVTTCDYCENRIHFDDSDTQIGPVSDTGYNCVYIVCPVCGEQIVVGGFYGKL